MTNPYIERVAERMMADDAIGQLNRHWSARGERFVHRIGYWLWRAGFDGVAARYSDATDPLIEWFGRHQRRFLSRWL